jgi:hypothetical protein
MAAWLQFGAKLNVVEYFSVEDHPEGFVLVLDRLAAAAQIDNAQPGAAQTSLPVQENAELIRPAMPQ